MMDFRAATRYAISLFKMAEEEGSFEILDLQLIEILKLVEKHPEIAHLLFNSTIAVAEKEDFIEKIVPAETSSLLVRFLKVLVKKKRFEELHLIWKVFHKLAEKKRGIQEVEVFTAVPLSSLAENRLAAMLKKKLSMEIRLVPRVDARLIGGIILRFDGREINSSFHSRLEDLRQELISSRP